VFWWEWMCACVCVHAHPSKVREQDWAFVKCVRSLFNTLVSMCVTSLLTCHQVHLSAHAGNTFRKTNYVDDWLSPVTVAWIQIRVPHCRWYLKEYSQIIWLHWTC
jgi:hypothetical protein